MPVSHPKRGREKEGKWVGEGAGLLQKVSACGWESLGKECWLEAPPVSGVKTLLSACSIQAFSGSSQGEWLWWEHHRASEGMTADSVPCSRFFGREI